jgi:hypothetical protein
VNHFGRVKFAEEPTFYILPDPKEEVKEPKVNSKKKVKAQKVANKKKEQESIELFLVENFNTLPPEKKVKVPSNLGCQTMTPTNKSQIDNKS